MKNLLLFFILFISTISIFCEQVNSEYINTAKFFDYETVSNENTIIKFHLNDSEIEKIIQNVDLPEINAAILPSYSRLVAIPDRGEVSAELINIDTEFDRSNTSFDRIVEIGCPAIFRDFRVVNITINPFQYNHQKEELNIIKNIEFSLTTSGRGGENIKVNRNKLSRSFESLYKSSILNYESYITRDTEYQQPSYLFIHPNNTQVETNLQYLLDWKHKKGFEVVSAHTGETGSSLVSIKNYLQDAYDNWENPPEFVCLVGDAGGTFNIPTAFLDGGEGDHYYSLLEGDDILADVIIGRLSIESYFHLQTIISKIFSYERSPYMGETDWFTNALLSADPSYSSPSTVITCLAIKELILDHNPDYTFDEVYSPPFASQMNSSLNNGVCYFVYRGQGGMNDWTPYGHSNGQKLFTAIIITCHTGNYYGVTGTSEALLRKGSPASPEGAIAAIGTTGPHTHTSFNNIITAGIFDCIFNEDIYYIGSALVRGKLLMYLNFPQNPANYVHQFCYWNNLMGDPGVEIWTDIPQVMEVIYEEQIALGTNYLEVNVFDETGLPLPGAWVTALMGDDVIFSTDFTDVNGSVLLPINTDSTGVVDLTVTKHNFIPHEGTFEIMQSNLNISVQDYYIDDDIYGTSSGNNDGFINPGEDIELSVGLHNFGSVSANNVIADISSESEYINITDDVEYYGTIPQGITAVPEDDFDFSVEPYALGGSEFRLDLEIEDDLSNIFHDFIYLYVSGPNLTVFDHTVDDGMNGQLDPGETAVLVATVENNGTTSVSDVYGTVSCFNNLLTFEDSTGFFGDIASGAQNNNNVDIFIVTANSQVLPGTQFMVELMLYNTSGYEQIVSFILEVGTVTVNDPLGPDTYGYYCYDDEDIDYYNAPVYEWIEIDPDYGGNGLVLDLNDYGNDGDIETINLPFTFFFYGIGYNEITVCTNGWICPGVTDQYSFMNWQLPGPLGPSPMIAPFWDDLLTANGHVCYYNDAAYHTFIVEWSDLQNEYNNDEETFQVILYDPAFYPTSTGDGEIKFQYKTINNVDQGSYRVQHGQYATVGIEDHTGMIGLEYTYNNQYPLAAKPLEDEMAILFTGPFISPEEPFVVLGGFTLIDENGNGIADYAENVDMQITLNNMGENPAIGISANISTEDPYITLNQSFSEYDDISGGSSQINLTDFNFDVDSNCPNGHNVMFTINISSNENDWEYYFSINLNAPELEIRNVSIINDENLDGILDPGETADLVVIIANSGGVAVWNLNLMLSTEDQYITINENQAFLEIIDVDGEESVTFNVTVSEDANTGHEAVFSLDIDADLEFNLQIIFQVIIGLCIENFENGNFTSLPWEHGGQADWTITSIDPYEGNYCAQSGIIDDYQSTYIELSMWVLFDNQISFWSKISSENGADFLTFYLDNLIIDSWSGISDWTQHIYPVPIGDHTFKWVYHKDSGGVSGSDCAWIDYIIFPPNGLGVTGNLTGEVILGAEGNVSDVLIIVCELTTNPNDNGFYTIDVPYGTYDVSASLIGFEIITYEDILIPPFETVVLDFELPYIAPPENLQAELIGNEVYLTWDEPGLTRTNKMNLYLLSDNSRVLQYYKIYRNENNGEFNLLSATTQTEYIDELIDPYYYGYYITAIYSNNSESNPTDTVFIDFTQIDLNTISNKTALKGNYPNPFNQHTAISFSVTQNAMSGSDGSSFVTLDIYNIKGQKVKELLIFSPSPGHTLSVTWDGTDDNNKPVSSGIYFYKLRAGDFQKVRKMVLMK